MTSIQDRRDAYMRQSLATIAEHGWMIQGVFPTEDDPGTQFAYTVGLTATGLSELVIAGLPFETMGELLNLAAQHSLGTELHAGDVLDSIASVPFRLIDAPEAEVNMARGLYGKDKVRALQLVWPDADGRYPGEPGWAYPDDAQPLYGRTA